MSVMPCKFFGTAQGCRYGDSCRFYHARGGIPNTFGMRPSAFGQQPQDLSKSQQNMETMIEMVKRDMVEWEQGHIYPFSCYGPTGGKPCVPGFDEIEISPDELRYQFYSNNRLPVDLSQHLSLLQQSRMQYKQIGPAVRNLLERVIIKGERIPFSGWETLLSQSQQGLFGGSGSQFGNAFGGSVPSQSQTTVFGQSTTGTSGGLFGTPASTFGGSPSMGGFGGTGALFGSPSSPALSTVQAATFGSGGALTTSGVFGGAVGQSQSTAFGAPPSLQQSNVFGGTGAGNSIFGTSGASTAFGTTASSSIFSSPQQSVGGGLFSSSPTTGIFGSGTQQSPAFGLQSQQIQFAPSQAVTQEGQQQQPSMNVSGSLFGTPPPQQPVSQSLSDSSGLPASGSFFSSQSSTVPNIQQPLTSATLPMSSFSSGNQFTASGMAPSGIGFGNQQPQPVEVDQKYVYTDESELTPEELESFLAPSFTLENIPIRPPPKSLCSMQPR